MSNAIKHVIMVAVMVLSCGCVSGPSIDYNTLFKVGQLGISQDDVEIVLGLPESVTTINDGIRSQYSYVIKNMPMFPSRDNVRMNPNGQTDKPSCIAFITYSEDRIAYKMDFNISTRLNPNFA